MSYHVEVRQISKNFWEAVLKNSSGKVKDVVRGKFSREEFFQHLDFYGYSELISSIEEFAA